LTSTLAAGLPHFSTNHMRCWGRDTFISFKGMFLLTGRFEEGKNHLLAFVACEFNGLIPNLLDSGRNPRYNSRDATWWFLLALKDYCEMAPAGTEILDCLVKSETWLKSVVSRIIKCHLEGIDFV